MKGQNIIVPVIGPMAHSSSDLQLITKTILDTEPWERDTGVIPLPWRGEKQAEIRQRAGTSGLCFGVMRWDGVIMVHPPVLRGIEMTIDKLRAEGHEVC